MTRADSTNKNKGTTENDWYIIESFDDMKSTRSLVQTSTFVKCSERVMTQRLKGTKRRALEEKRLQEELEK